MDDTQKFDEKAETKDAEALSFAHNKGLFI